MKYFYLLILSILSFTINAQSYYFGVKAGPAANFQRWSGFDADPLISVNGDIFLESAPEDKKNIFYGSAGFRTRGSGWRFGNINSQVNFKTIKFMFRNTVLELGVKRMLTDDVDKRPFYFIGLRGEYTVGTNLKQYDGNFFYPTNPFVRKLNYGFSFGGGYEFKFRDMIDFYVELGMHPDITAQYFQPEIFNIRDPFSGQNISIQEREIRNLSLELKFAMKFLRKVEYY